MLTYRLTEDEIGDIEGKHLERSCVFSPDLACANAQTGINRLLDEAYRFMKMFEICTECGYSFLRR